MRYLLIGMVAAMGLSVSCATYSPNQATEQTQLQMREFQTRSYEIDNEMAVLKAVANVLQDEGYIITNAESELGIITAEKEASIEDGTEKFFSILFFGVNARYKKNSIIESTANVTQFGENVKVRMIFQVKAYDNHGQLITLGQVDDEQFYQDFFAKVDKGIFIQKEGI